MMQTKFDFSFLQVGFTLLDVRQRDPHGKSLKPHARNVLEGLIQ